MKRRPLLGLALALAAPCWPAAQAAETSSPAAPPSAAALALQRQAQAVVEAVTAALTRLGSGLRQRPQVVVRNEPFLIGINFVDPAPPQLVVPDWAGLGEMRGLFEQLVQQSGQSVAPQTFFEDTFNWALVAHELAHQLIHERVPAARQLDLYGEEALANRFMVAFWASQDPAGGASARLDRCGQVWAALAQKLPSPVPAGVDPHAHFVRQYEALTQDPMAYGWYQFQWMAAAWQARQTLRFEAVVQELLGGRPGAA